MTANAVQSRTPLSGCVYRKCFDIFHNVEIIMKSVRFIINVIWRVLMAGLKGQTSFERNFLFTVCNATTELIIITEFGKEMSCFRQRKGEKLL